MPSVWLQFRRTAFRVALELRQALREVDPDALAPRAASLVFIVGGLLALAAAYVVPDFRVEPSVGVIAGVAVAFGVGSLAAPWPRLNPYADLVMPLFAFVLYAWGGAIAHGAPVPYLALLPLPFVFVGITQRPGTSAALAPVAAVALVVADRFAFDATFVATVVFVLPMLVLVGEALAFAHSRRISAEARVSRLLDAVRVLARVDDQRQGAQLVASLSAELLGADAVAVLVADRRGSQRLLNRAFFGHPALADSAPLLVDALGTQGFDAYETRFFSDPQRLRSVAPAATCVQAAATVPLPGSGPVPIGVVIAMWASPRSHLPASARQAAELLSEEAGRMFRRLRTSEELVHDAETDPLTQLANRRTFARALSTMQPGDALVLVDLDNFKQVNDRHGHQAGDETLRRLARCLRESARQVDCVARYGGEEFAVVLPDAGIGGAQTMIARVRRAWGAQDPLTTFSAGIAGHDAGRSPRETLRLADGALYAAKAAGRDCDMLAAESQIEVVLP